MDSLLIHSTQGDYPVQFLDSLHELVQAQLENPATVLILDARVMELYREQLSPLLTAFPFLSLEASEANKTLAGVELCARFFQASGCSRSSTVVAIGGGIIQDICALSAHIYYRGISWSFLPTTLLSMVDSCIGAKCGVNLGAFKNQLGAFHSPSHVKICPAFLDTLEESDVASGYGELLKLMITSSEHRFNELARIVKEGGLRNLQVPLLIRQGLEIKRAIIEQDEYDLGLRLTLNYGHTFGHALEAVTEHALPHGLAVAWGMDLVNHLAEKRGLLAPLCRERITKFIRDCLPAVKLPPLQANNLLEGLKRDKKASGGNISLVFLRAFGHLERIAVPLDERLKSEIEDYLCHRNVFC